METIRTWAVGLCAACLITGILSFFIPSKEFIGVLKAAFAAFLITVLVMPFLAHRELFKMPQIAAESSESEHENNFVNEAIINAAANSLREQIAQLLRQKKLTFSDVDICMHMTEDGSIDISEITVSGVEQGKAQLLHDLLKKKLGLEVSVRI